MLFLQEKMVQLRIKEAVARYNKNRKDGEEKLYLTNVADYVFRDRDIKKLHKSIAFQHLVHGRTQRPMLQHLIDIADKTNVTMDFLFGREDDNGEK